MSFSNEILSCQQLKMTKSHCDEELISSIASLSSPLSFKFGTLELPHTSILINREIISTLEPTLPDIQSFSSTHTSTVHTQRISSTLKTRLLLHLLIFNSLLIKSPKQFLLRK